MKKAQLPLIAELSLRDTEDSTPKTTSKFWGTDNPRHLRVIHALMTRPRKREDVDRIAGASNSPELIAELRRRGLTITCHRTPAIDRDGYPIKFGVYAFDEDDRRKILKWQASNQSRNPYLKYEKAKRKWDEANPDATPEQRDAALIRIAKKFEV
jgi:hypothetical protein